jgi:UDP-2-acetamido-3-amino-2,3-dideoxy-glucuronate N-acetyltransferase
MRRVDAVILATPPNAHASQAAAALVNGKHVFVEKPMTLRTRDALDLEKLAVATRCKLMVGHILRYHPAVVRFHQVVSTGALGRIRALHSARLGAAPLADDEQSWWALAPHDISVMRSLVGTDPTSVRATLVPSPFHGGEAVRAVLSFPGNVNGTIVVSAHAAQKTRRLVVVGTQKTGVFDDTEPHEKIRIYPSDAGLSDASEFVATAQVESIAHPNNEPLLVEARHFVSSILEGTPIPTDAAEGRAVVVVLEAGIRSLRAGGKHVVIRSAGSALPFAARG